MIRRFVPFLRRLRAYLRLRRDAVELAESTLFDAAWYRANNADLGGISYPALHYLRRGAAEGRDPGPAFSGDAYRARYPDVDMSDANPLLHYLRIGRDERRAIVPSAPGSLPRFALDDPGYQRWVAACDQTAGHCVAALPCRPLFLVAAAAASAALRQSLAAQIYPHWRLVADTGQDFYLDRDWDYLLRLPDDCRLAAGALFYLAQASDGGARILHADLDVMRETGQRHSPVFHSIWEPEFGQAMPAIHAVRRTPGLVEVRHVPRIVFHCAAQPPPVPMPLPAASPGWPRVSVIIPSRDNPRMLAHCLRDIRERTDYPDVEIIVVDNASRTYRARRLLGSLQQYPAIRVFDFPAAFNWSAMNNAAARMARGEVLLLLNDDISVRDPGWLKELVALAMRPGIGIMGAKLLYPNGRIQHAGISLGAGAVARHLYRHAHADDPGHAGMLSQRRSVAAVTGACMAIRKELFVAVGGLEEAHLGVTNADIDLCLRVRAHGQRVVWTPFAVLAHHEAATRGLDSTDADRARLRAERAYLVRRWGAVAQNDPYSNPNLDLVGERLALASPRRPAAG